MGIEVEHVLSISHNESKPDNYLRFGKFSPDGSLISTVANDNTLKIFENPVSPFYTNITNTAISDNLISDEFRDFCWFPRFTFTEEASKCFALASRGHPVNLYSTSFKPYFSYKPQDYNGDLAESYTVTFHPLGGMIVIGLKNQIQLFDVIHSTNPLQILGFGTRKDKGRIGIVSSVSFNVDGRRYLIGTHSGFIALCENTDYSFLSDPQHKQGGINQLCWVDDNTFLVGSRQDMFIREYDIREGLVARYKRPSISTQKLPFCTYHAYIIAGTSDSKLQIINRTSNCCDKAYLVDNPCGVCDIDGNLLLLCTGTRYPSQATINCEGIELNTCGSRFNLYKLIES